MTTVTLNEELQARFRAIATPDEDWNRFVAGATKELIERREREATRWAAARAEAQTILNGPRRPYDPEATYRKYQEKYGWSDLSHLTDDELVEQAEAALAALPPEKIVEAERRGLL